MDGPVPNRFFAPGPNSRYAASGARPAGFFDGLWHGVISPITFIVSLYDDDVAIYEANNRGGWYDFGFLIGVGGTLGSAGASAS